MIDNVKDEADDFYVVSSDSVEHSPELREFNASQVWHVQVFWNELFLYVVAVERVLFDELCLLFY